MIDPAGHRLFRDLVEANRGFVLTTHVNPDGDAIGSEIALARYLRGRGVDEVRVVNQDVTPHGLRFLEDDVHRAEVFDPAVHAGLFDDGRLIVLLDNSAPDRLGRLEKILRARAERVLCIDHHPTRETPWIHNILDVESCATAAMVHDLIRAGGRTPDARAAEALFVGLATDTGFFRFNSTTARAFEIAAELMKLGVRPARCYREVYERNSPAFTRLLGEALSGLRLDAGGAVASVTVTRDAVERHGAQDEDTSEMVTSLLALDGVRVALLFREVADGRVKVSLRSKGDLDVRALAAEFGGGGHRNASGIVAAGVLGELAERVIARASVLVGAGRL